MEPAPLINRQSVHRDTIAYPIPDLVTVASGAPPRRASITTQLARLQSNPPGHLRDLSIGLENHRAAGRGFEAISLRPHPGLID